MVISIEIFSVAWNVSEILAKRPCQATPKLPSRVPRLKSTFTRKYWSYKQFQVKRYIKISTSTTRLPNLDSKHVNLQQQRTATNLAPKRGYPSWEYKKCSHKGANEAFCLKYKEIAMSVHWSSLVRVDRWGWDSAEILLSHPMKGVGG